MYGFLLWGFRLVGCGFDFQSTGVAIERHPAIQVVGLSWSLPAEYCALFRSSTHPTRTRYRIGSGSFSAHSRLSPINFIPDSVTNFPHIPTAITECLGAAVCFVGALKRIHTHDTQFSGSTHLPPPLPYTSASCPERQPRRFALTVLADGPVMKPI
ncbi:hypothetical protein HGRIS_004464 [Hohenbuehelia grisea]|uniref:Secreted protein n=1 Tax=Hohenbuehelia grisea TaxID=104357 RepID=A0ABR3JBY2_9AGAR